MVAAFGSTHAELLRTRGCWISLHRSMTDQPRKLGKYTLQRHIATGGMAKIWLAEQAGPGGFNKELVIKQILPHFADDAQFTTMFLDEARLAAQLSHPKIAQIYELGEIDAQYFIAMEYIPGIDLDVLLQKSNDRDEPIPVTIVCKVMMDVLEALDYAHEFTDKNGRPFNLVHRDVSPQNVLISNDGIVKLCDFGVAKAVANQTKTQPGAVKGKFAYMAPEQIQNSQAIDRRADIFAAGIMFYELLTGTKPYGDELAAVNNIIAGTHEDPRSIRSDVPDELVAIIEKALQKSPDARYPDAHSMLRDIESFLREGGAYVGDRELSRYVRTMQGLPVTRHSQPSVSVEGEMVDPHDDTGEQPVAKRSETAQVAAPATAPNDEVAPAKSFAPLYAVFALVIVGIVAALAFIALTVLAPPDEPVDEPKKQVEQPVAQQKPKANPSLLKASGGRQVFIRTKPTSEIYMDGQLVGDTPFQAFLIPGQTYHLEFRGEGRSKKKQIVITGKEESLPVIEF